MVTTSTPRAPATARSFTSDVLRSPKIIAVRVDTWVPVSSASRFSDGRGFLVLRAVSSAAISHVAHGSGASRFSLTSTDLPRATRRLSSPQRRQSVYNFQPRKHVSPHVGHPCSCLLYTSSEPTRRT